MDSARRSGVNRDRATTWPCRPIQDPTPRLTVGLPLARSCPRQDRSPEPFDAVAAQYKKPAHGAGSWIRFKHSGSATCAERNRAEGTPSALPTFRTFADPSGRGSSADHGNSALPAVLCRGHFCVIEDNARIDLFAAAGPRAPGESASHAPDVRSRRSDYFASGVVLPTKVSNGL